MKYRTIKSYSTTKFTEKGSKFIGHATPVQNEEEAEQELQKLRKTYYNATHNCYAWKIGMGTDTQYRFSDDGEPSGTAGKPIYDMLVKHGVTNTLVVVTRYFGGTKLGTGGLVKAYSHSADMTLSESKILTKEVGEKIKFNCSYEDHPIILRVMSTFPVIRIEQTFTENVSLLIEIDEEFIPALKTDLRNATGGRVDNWKTGNSEF